MPPPIPKPKSKPTAPALTQRPHYPYTIHRIYLCGHPDDYIQIERAQNARPPRILHTLVPQPRVVAGVSVRPYRQIQQRCAVCAYSFGQGSSSRFRNKVEEGRDSMKNGFMSVLVRERFSGRGEWSIPWQEDREDGPGNDEYRRLKELHGHIEAGSHLIPHSAMSYQDRAVRKTVGGPAREGAGKIAYVLQTAVHAVLAEGLGHDNFDDAELEREQLIEEINALLPPKVTDRGSSVHTRDKQAQSPQRRTSSNTRGSPHSPIVPSPLSPRSPQPTIPRSPTGNSPQPWRLSAPRQPRQSPQHTHHRPRPARPKSPTRSHQEITYHRALALAALEGRVPSIPTPADRHSDTTPQPPPRPRPDRSNAPSHIAHQRPFGPASSSGGTTLSYGDHPRRYKGVSIAAVMDTLYPEDEDPKRVGIDDGEEVGGRGSHGSFRSFESQRHPGPKARSTRSGGFGAECAESE
ncbi:hypothetical protein PMIN02_001174 [Paraphaeosphaeria minitans]|uniref:Uncharacterized protein n=1 Tax=Paraphaeosphaeria minitans TaxID=565426 RepID=A0A9P6KU09_9PLEO|nr:hypothetical protein PMIN01_04145 [Paraphaeosphaeria minitans]